MKIHPLIYANAMHLCLYVHSLMYTMLTAAVMQCDTCCIVTSEPVLLVLLNKPYFNAYLEFYQFDQ